MFAGQNGSGKSVLKSHLPQPLLGIYLNPDEIEQEIRNRGFLEFSSYGVTTCDEEVLPFFIGSPFLRDTGNTASAARLSFASGRLDFSGVAVNSYLA